MHAFAGSFAILSSAAVLIAGGNEARDLQDEGRALVAQKRFEEAANRYEEAAHSAVAAGDLHSAYWCLDLAASMPGADFDHARRIDYIERALALLERCDRKDRRWRTIDLVNAAGMHMRVETLHTESASFSRGFAHHENAELRVREYWGGTPTEAALSRAPAQAIGAYIQLLTERAQYEVMAGHLPRAEGTLRTACDLASRIYPREDGRAEMLARAMNNLSVLLGEMGRGRESWAAARTAAQYRVRSTASLIAEVGELRHRAEREGPSEAIVTGLLARAASLRAASREESALATERRAATVLARIAGRADDALALMDRVIEAAAGRRFCEVAAESSLWRAKARAEHARPGVEADFLASLAFYRAAGYKPREYALYYAYAGWLLDENRLAEALAVSTEALRLNAFMECRWRRPEALARHAAILRAAGRLAEADAAWAEALGLLDALPDLDPNRRLEVVVHYMEHLAVNGRDGELRQWTERARTFSETTDLTDYERQPLVEFKVPAGTARPLASAPVAPPDLQPLYLAVRTPHPGDHAGGFLWIVNPAAVSQRVPVRVEPAEGAEIVRSAQGHWLLRGVAGALTNREQLVEVPAQALLPIACELVSAADPVRIGVVAGACSARVEVVAGGAPDSVANVQASLAAANPFHAVPLYHELPASAAAGAFRVRTSAPGRIEVYAAFGGALLAVDAEGDGDYSDPGDVVLSDANRDTWPDLPEGIGAVLVRVYPVANCPAIDTLDVVVETRDDSSAWRAAGHDRILGFSRAAIRPASGP